MTCLECSEEERVFSCFECLSAHDICPHCHQKPKVTRISALTKVIKNSEVVCLKNYDGDFGEEKMDTDLRTLKCGWQGKLQDLDSHLSTECQLVKIMCSFVGCEALVERCFLLDHELNCALNTSLCTCGEQVQTSCIGVHQEICPHKLVPCGLGIGCTSQVYGAIYYTYTGYMYISNSML